MSPEFRTRLLSSSVAASPDGECWLLAAGPAIRRRLLAELSGGGLRPWLRILTLEEAVDLLARQLHDGPRLLRRGEPVLLAAELLRRHHGELPYLGGFVASGESALEGVAAITAQALRQLAQTPAPPADSPKVRDLRFLLERRRERCAELNVEEVFERPSRLARALDDGLCVVPPAATLILPDFLPPGLRSFVAALGRRLELKTLLEPELVDGFDKTAYSTDGLAETRRLFTGADLATATFDETRSERRALLAWLFEEGDPPAELPESVRPWRALDAVDEVRRVAREIKRRCAEGESPERFAVVAPRLDPYVGLLSAEFAARGIPFKLPGGEPLIASTPAQVLRTLLSLLQRPGREELYAFLAHPALERPQLPEPGEVRRRLAEFAQYLPPAPPGVNPLDFWTAERPAAGRLDPGSFDRLARKARVSGLPRGWEDRLTSGERLEQAWLLPVLNRLNDDQAGADVELAEREADVERTRRRLFELVAVLRLLERLEELRDPKLEIGGLLESVVDQLEERRFTPRLQRSLFERLLEADPEETGDEGVVVVERRRAEAVSRAHFELNKALNAVRVVADFARNVLQAPLRGVDQLRRLIDEELVARSVRIPGPDAGVTISDFAGTRGYGPGELFLIGLTNEAFPARSEGGLLGGIGGVSFDPHDESIFLLRRLLARAETLWLSCPGVSGSEESRPAPPLNDLLELLNGQPSRGPEHPAGLPTSPGELLARDPESPLLTGESRRSLESAAAYLRAVASPGFTAYEGQVDEDLLESIPGADARGELSITALDNYVDCPRKFFFSRLLGLRELPEVRDEAESNIIGALVHRALEIFFTGYSRQGRTLLEPRPPEPVSEERWAEDCARMLDSAAWAFVESGYLDPAVEPSPEEQIRRGLTGAGAALEAQRRELVDGLEKPEEGQPWGLLKGALYIQRELILTLPRELEMKFGGEAGEPLEVGGALLNGKIDRVDVDTRTGILAVYDYKTSSSSSLKNNRKRELLSPVKGLSSTTVVNLQLPLYAMAAQRRYGSERLRGAVISLNSESVNLPADHPSQTKYNEGSVHEYIALEKAGNSFSVEPYVGVERLADYEKVVEMIIAFMRRGVFCPVTLKKAKGCGNCPFTVACDDDFQAIKLLKKASAGGANDGNA